MNKFLEAVSKNDFYTENGAVSNSTTGNGILDYFSKSGAYRDRPIEQVYADISRMYAESPLITLQVLFYLRMITRKEKGFLPTLDTQRGQGARDEYRKAISWLAKNQPKVLYDNLWLMPVVGCWKDLWHEDLIDVLDRTQVIELINRGLGDSYNKDLLSKYLPKIRSKSNTSTPRHAKLNLFARQLCKDLGWSERDYRKFKSRGIAHTWQQNSCKGLYNNIDFNKISGKALFLLANHRSKGDKKTFIERHGLVEKYTKWIDSKPVAKFTGYVYELGAKAKRVSDLSIAEKKTIDKQFDGLLQTAKDNKNRLNENIWCALDTSASMTSSVVKGITALDICVSLGVFFSSLNEGAFKDNVIMFDNQSRKLALKGSFTDKIQQIYSAQVGWGGTNFQSVIDEIVRVRKANPKIPVEDYPTTLLVVSDMQFNPTGTNETNHKTLMRKLREVGLPDINVIWWQVTGRTKDFPSTITDKGTTLISGFDGSVLTLITDEGSSKVDPVTGETVRLNPFESMLKALDQEVLRQVKV